MLCLFREVFPKAQLRLQRIAGSNWRELERLCRYLRRAFLASAGYDEADLDERARLY